MPALRIEETDEEVFHFCRVSCAIVVHAIRVSDEDQRRLRLLRSYAPALIAT
ncbi:MAG: hypothetical protein ABSC38_03285 [Verrucomicrobiia bacterium]